MERRGIKVETHDTPAGWNLLPVFCFQEGLPVFCSEENIGWNKGHKSHIHPHFAVAPVKLFREDHQNQDFRINDIQAKKVL
jgi:hypothetical protein